MKEKQLKEAPIGIVIHDYKIPKKGIKKKIIYHFSDVHLTEYDALSSEKEIEDAKKSTESWKGIRNYFATTYNEPYTKEQEASAKEHFDNLLKVSQTGDAFLMAGDICDYISGANLRLIESQLENIKTPFMAVCGNHEKKDSIPDGGIFSRIKDSIQTVDLGDMVIVGVDNSEHKITEYQVKELVKVLDEGKPIGILMHIPFITEQNEALLKRSSPDFYINNQEASKEAFEFLEIIKKNSEKIVGVFAGHLHYTSNSEITSGLVQYVSTQGILGHINRYEIGE